MSAKLLLTACGAALLALGPAGAQTYQTEPPAAAPPRLEAPPSGPEIQSQPPSSPHRQPTVPRDGRVLPAPDSPLGIGSDRSDLGRDCARAQSRVQQTICKNRDLAQMDRDVARFAGALPGGAKQGAWVASLESCEAGATTIYDGPIYNCLRTRYQARLVQLSRMAGGRISGSYKLAGRAGDGSMTIVEWPEGGATVHFNMLTADGARACNTRVDAQVSQGVIEGRPQGLPGCRVAIQVNRGQAQVMSNGCTSLCEMGERVDGTYLSLGTQAPAARPSRTPQTAPKPAAPKSTAPRY